MLSKPPLYPTARIPEEIVGRSNMAVFVDHFKVASTPGDWPEKILNREFGKEVRAKIAATYRVLRANGYYPLRVTESNKIIWGTVLKSDAQVIFERDLPRIQKMTREELREEYCRINKNSFSME